MTHAEIAAIAQLGAKRTRRLIEEAQRDFATAEPAVLVLALALECALKQTKPASFRPFVTAYLPNLREALR